MALDLLHRWLHLIKRRFKDYWVALFIGAIATLAILLIWQKLYIREQRHFAQLVQQEANNIQSILNRELSSRIVSLNRLAKRWELSNGTPREFWEADVSNYLDDTHGYQAIHWVDPSFIIRWIVPLQGNEQVQDMDLTQERRRRISLQVARDLNQIILSKHISLVQGGEGFLVIIPLFVNERHDGFIVGVFEFTALFDGILPISPLYTTQIYDRGHLVYSSGDFSESPFQQTSLVRAYGSDWTVQVSPQPLWIEQGKSPLPTIVLSAGLIIVWTMALTVYLGQYSWRYAHETRKINHKLQKEIIHRQQIEAILLDSQTQYQTLVENSPDIIQRFDTNFKHIYVSPILSQLTGIPNHTWIGKTCRDLPFSAPMADSWEAAANQLLTTGEKQMIEFEAETVNGWRYLEMAIVPEINEAKNITSILCISRDVTARKQAETSLKLSQAKFEALATNMPGMVYSYCPHNSEKPHYFKFVSHHCLDIFELEPNRILADINSLINLIHQDDLPSLRASMKQSFEQFLPWYWQGRIITNSGSIKWVECNAQPQSTPEGNIWHGIVFDISERKKYEENLRQFQGIVAATAEAIALINRDYIYQIVNKTYANLTEKSEDYIINNTIDNVLGKQIFTQTVKPLFDRCLAGEIVRYESWFNFPGKTRFIGVTYSPILQPDSTVKEVIVTVRDLTSLKQAEIAMKKQSDRQDILSKVTNRIRRSLHLQDILNTTVVEVSKVLGNDIVLVCKFQLNWSHQIIAHSEELCRDSHRLFCVIDPVMTIKIDQIIWQIAQLCRSGQINASVEMWQQFQGPTHLIFPIWLEDDELWGLLIAYFSSEDSNYKPPEIEMLKQLTEQLAIAIQQGELYHQLQMAHQELEKVYNLDALTGIPNRRHFDHVLQQEWLQLQREQQPLSIIMCDIDYFKCYNDTYGHIAGDKCLQKVAHALKKCLKRPRDLVARYGGEEFVILLPNTPTEGAIEISQQIQEAVFELNMEPGAIPANFQRVTMSMGIASQIPTPQQSPTQLIFAADCALYQAKNNGRNQYVIGATDSHRL
ncbi:diguanylate cyclase domain-containing protein [Arthrospira sp. PCC 8006]|uniref:diguanylate cyclase domain-containing protein n=1 Tax=Arthrospira sp. PCC 8006 TaxID=1982224 RepID=UPI00396F5969